MAFSDEKDLAGLERLIRVLRKHGVTHYAHDSLELRLGRVAIAPPRDAEVLFWVADTGAGIAAEDVPHLFDRFWQARKAGRRGAGLGLPIVKGIVEAHSGRIWVESTPGEGSTFFFTIPTAARAEQRRPEPALRID